MKFKDNRGFTLIELLAVITIIGVLAMIAIPTVNGIIQNVRKNVYVNDAKNFKKEVQKEVIDETWPINDPDTTYYIHINNVVPGGKPSPSPWADWLDAYVVVTVDQKGSYKFHWLSIDEAGWKTDLVVADTMVRGDVYKSNVKRVNYREALEGTSKITILDANGVWRSFEPHLELTSTEAEKCYSYDDLGDGTVTIIKYKKSCGTDIVIPARIDGKVVSAIHYSAFENMGLTSVFIPDTIKSIGSRAFINNSLTQLYVPPSVTNIESHAFANNKLTNLTLEEGLTYIGANSFQNNQLTVALVPNSVTTLGACSYCQNPIPNPSFLYKQNGDIVDYSTVRGYIGDMTEFEGNTFIIPAEVNGTPLTKISASAFANMNLNDWTVVVPDTVTEIGDSAFAYSKVAHINLPYGLKRIGSNALYYNSLKELSIPETVTYIGSQAFTGNQVTDPNTMWIYNRTSSGIDYTKLIGYAGKNRRDVVIPASRNGKALKTIDGGAFRYQSLKGTITIPDSVTSIGQQAFSLNDLDDVVNGTGDTEVAPFVYSRKAGGGYDDTSILTYGGKGSKVTVPSGVKRLEIGAFHYSYISGIELPEGLEYIGSSAFTVCYLEGTVVIPSTVTHIGSNAFKKENTWGAHNVGLTKIVNKTNRAFDWKAIVGGSKPANFKTGIAANWYGDIEITDK